MPQLPLDPMARGRTDGDGHEKKVEPLELFFDLVFVFAVTQITARLAYDTSWTGLGKGLIILAAIWWAWGAYAWLTNEIDAARTSVRLTMFASMAAMLTAALAIPDAFEDSAWTFAIAYLVVRVLHIALFIVGTEHADVRMAARALAPTAVAAPSLLLVGAAVDNGTAQVALWGGALAVDYVSGGLRGIGGWRLSPTHFAERHGLVVIIALGESIIAIGVGAGEVPLDLRTITAATLGIVVAATLWMTYFDDAPHRIEGRLHALEGRARNATARDVYSFLHLPMVAGIVLLALGLKKTIEHAADPLELVPATALCGGVALYFVSQAVVRLRAFGDVPWSRLVMAAVCAAFLPVALQTSALAALAGLAGACAALLGYELTRSPSRPVVTRPEGSAGHAP